MGTLQVRLVCLRSRAFQRASWQMIGRRIISLKVLYRFQDSSHLLIDQLVLQANLPPSGADEMIII